MRKGKGRKRNERKGGVIPPFFFNKILDVKRLIYGIDFFYIYMI